MGETDADGNTPLHLATKVALGEYIGEEPLIEEVPTTRPPWTEMASSLGTLLSQRTTETGRAGRCFTNCVCYCVVARLCPATICALRRVSPSFLDKVQYARCGGRRMGPARQPSLGGYGGYGGSPPTAERHHRIVCRTQ